MSSSDSWHLVCLSSLYMCGENVLRDDQGTRWEPCSNCSASSFGGIASDKANFPCKSYLMVYQQFPVLKCPHKWSQSCTPSYPSFHVRRTCSRIGSSTQAFSRCSTCRFSGCLDMWKSCDMHVMCMWCACDVHVLEVLFLHYILVSCWYMLCIYIYIRVCMYVCMDGWMDGCMDVWMYGCMDVWMYGCMYVCMHACMHVYCNHMIL